MSEGRSRQPSRTVAAAVAALLILAPAIAFVAGHRGRPIENRPSRAFDGVTGWQSFSDFGGFMADHLPLRAGAVRVDGWADQHVFSEDPAFGGSATPRVIHGRDGVLFLADAIDNACAPNAPPEQTVANLARLSSIIAGSGRDVLTMVAPDKSTVHPELLPEDFPRTQCLMDYIHSLWRGFDQAAIPGFVNLLEPLQRATGASRELLYLRKDSHWDNAGSLIAVRAAIDRLAPGLWRDDEIRYNGLTDYTGDLTGMEGNSQVDQAPQYAISRPDVTSVLVEPIDTTSDGLNRHFVNSAPAGRLVPGKTLMLLDSYGLAALPQLVPFFEDLTVVRLVDYNPERFESLISAADRVWVMTVERSAAYRLSYEIGSAEFLDRLAASLPHRQAG